MKSAERKVGSGRPAIKLNKTSRKRLVKAAVDKKGVTEMKLAKKFGVSQPYVPRVLKEEGVTRYKQQKCPDWTPELRESQKAVQKEDSSWPLPTKFRCEGGQ